MQVPVHCARAQQRVGERVPTHHNKVLKSNGFLTLNHR